MVEALVTKIIRFSAVDGPGNRSVIFFQGCNYDCWFCHNPETIALKNADAKKMTVDDIFDEIGSSIHFIRGITVSGGECTLHATFIIDLFKEAKRRGLDTYIDSNGSYDFAKHPELLEVTDSVMLDVKTTSDEEHTLITRVTNRIVLKNIDTLGELNKLYEIRTVISPNMFDCEQTVRDASLRIAKYPQTRYKLIKFRKNGVREPYKETLESPTQAFMENLEKIAHESGVIETIIT